MQILAPFLALAALTAASPHTHHRHVHQKKNPIARPDINEALVNGIPGKLISSAAAPAASPSPASSPAEVVAPASQASPSPAAVAAVSSPKAAAAPAAASPSPAAAAASPVVANVKNVASTAINDISSIANRLSALSVKQGKNSQANNGAVWIGSDGPYTNTFTNNAASDIVLVIWGEKASWVNANQPHITIPLTSGQSTTISFANGQIGGWAGIYPDTVTQNGQIMNTWGEYTFANPWSTVDVSREVKMSGNSMSIKTPQCVTDMDTCVFVCTDGSDSCWTAYTLKNCANGSQPGATHGFHEGAASGGCSGMGSSAHLTTNFG